MLAVLASIAAVAGGQLAVTVDPLHPRAGERVTVSLTGQVGDRGRLYVFRNTSRRCADTADGERRIGRRMALWAVTEPFERRVRFTARRTSWVCVYLYAISCDAAGRNCGFATGLPPDAGWAQVGVRVRPPSQSVNSAAGSGRVIT